MSGIIFLVLAALQGITGVLPISGFGHVVLISTILGVSGSLTKSAAVILHLGTAAAVIYQFRKDLLKTVYALAGLFTDIWHNILQWFLHRTDPENADYVRLFSDNYSRLLVLMAVSTALTGGAGCLVDLIFGDYAGSILVTFTGFLVTALVLIVCANTLSYKRGPKDVELKDPVIIGLFQGFGVLPGFSSLALARSAGYLCGFSDRFTRRCVYLLTLPPVFGSLIYFALRGEMVSFGVSVPICILAVIISAAAGIVTLKLSFRQMGRSSSRRLGIYCLGAAVVSLLVYFIK